MKKSGRIHIQLVTREVWAEVGQGGYGGIWGEFALASPTTFLNTEHIQALLAQPKISRIKYK